ncbi:MAG: protein kinase [Planctomycetia bacterium]|nr:protein kinase [Planctomycetia bacterium]
MKCELVISKGPDSEQRFEIAAEGELLLGRGEDCGVRLRDPSVSRHQCRICLEADRVTLIDLSSRWGTLVNGRSIKEGELKSGDHITLGDTEVIVLLSSLAEDTTLPPRTRPMLDQEPTAEFPQPILDEPFVPPPLPNVAMTPLPAKKKSPKSMSAATVTQPKSQPGFHPPPAVVDRRFGELNLESVIAIGRTGIVYASTNLESGEKLAVKIFYPEVLPEGEPRDRFVRAMRTMINARHDNLVRLHRAGSQRGICYTVSEFIDGRSAARLLAASNGAGLDWQTVRHIAQGVASALQFAFQNNFVHRNVTPSNILIRESDQAVKLGDLALSKALIGANAFDVTRTNSVLGQLSYLSPEQIEHAPGQNHLSDLYSLGASLYELLTGHPPFHGDSASDVLRQIQSREPEPIRASRPDVPAELEAIILRLLAKQPHDRFATPMDLWSELQFKS